jgi:hypothetical protein
MKRDLQIHHRILAFFHPGDHKLSVPERIVKTLCTSDGRVLVRFKLQGDRPDVLVHIQPCSDCARRLATQSSLVQPSDSGDEIAARNPVGAEKETGSWKARHLMRCTKKKVQVRWRGGTTQWIPRSDLSRDLRDDVSYFVRRYHEEREQGITIDPCTAV